MTRYLVTTELKTTWWMKFLRFIKLKPKRNEFFLMLGSDGFKSGEYLYAGDDTKILILRKCT